MILEVLKSKKSIEKSVTNSAANSITILCFARYSFSAYDFSYINITGANMAGSICHFTNFKNACLEKVNFSNSELIETDFSFSNMNDVSFG